MNTRIASARPARAGFTLAEVAVTILIVGIGLVLVLQGLNSAKLTAAHTANLKLARSFGLLTMGQIEAGVFQEDIEDLRGTYAEEGREDFFFEVLLGDETFTERDPDDGPFDLWSYQRDQEEDDYDSDLDEDEEATEPYETVQIRITYPKVREFTNELILERWVPWEQVYGPSEDEELDQAPPPTEGEGP